MEFVCHAPHHFMGKQEKENDFHFVEHLKCTFIITDVNHSNIECEHLGLTGELISHLLSLGLERFV